MKKRGWDLPNTKVGADAGTLRFGNCMSTTQISVSEAHRRAVAATADIQGHSRIGAPPRYNRAAAPLNSDFSGPRGSLGRDDGAIVESWGGGLATLGESSGRYNRAGRWPVDAGVDVNQIGWPDERR